MPETHLQTMTTWSKCSQDALCARNVMTFVLATVIRIQTLEKEGGFRWSRSFVLVAMNQQVKTIVKETGRGEGPAVYNENYPTGLLWYKPKSKEPMGGRSQNSEEKSIDGGRKLHVHQQPTRKIPSVMCVINRYSKVWRFQFCLWHRWNVGYSNCSQEC